MQAIAQQTKPSKRVEARWEAGCKLWDSGAPIELIAALYNVTTKGMNARKQKFRKDYGWFEPRSNSVPLAITANDIIEKTSLNLDKTREISLTIPLHDAMVWHAYDGFRDIHYLSGNQQTVFKAAALVQPPQFRGHGEFALVKVQYDDYKWYVL